MNFLAAQALERAKVPLSAYQKFLLEGAKEYTAISAVRFPNEEKSKEESWYSKYQKVQYYQMFDWEKEE